MENKINIGILGCANIAKRHILPALLDLPDLFNVIGIASRDYSKAQSFAENFNIKPFDGYDTLLNTKGLDAIYIPLVNSLHPQYIEDAIIRGIHVLVEKPLASKHNEVVRLNNLARDKSLVLLENFQFRYHSQLQYIKELLANNAIGEIRCLRSSFGFPGLNSQDIRYNKELDGGALLDTGVYPIKIAQIFLGQNISVKAANMNSLSDKEVDIWGGAYLKQNDGDLFAEIAFGFNHHYQCNIEIWGSHGKISTNRIFTAHPSHIPVIHIENNEGSKSIELKKDNHFKNMLRHLHQLITNRNIEDINREYQENINQSRLINEVKLISNE